MGLISGLKTYVKPSTMSTAPVQTADHTSRILTPDQRRTHSSSTPSTWSPAPPARFSSRSDHPEFHALKYEVLGNHVLSKALREGMIRDRTSEREGLFLRRARNDYLTFPQSHADRNSVLLQAVRALNPTVSLADSWPISVTLTGGRSS